MTTCRKIVNYRKTLKFPDDCQISEEAESLIRALICDVKERLNFDGIKKHPFFKGVDWDNIRKTRPPIVPTVRNETDTQNFDKFEEVAEEDPVGQLPSTKIEQHAAFVGYTFRRDAAPKGLTDVFGMFSFLLVDRTDFEFLNCPLLLFFACSCS